MTNKVQIEGLDDLKAAFAKLDKAMQGQTLKNAVRAGSLIIERGAIVKCPVLTGNLRRSIHTEINGTNTLVQADIGTDVGYAPHVEFGTVHMAAQPYLRPAFDESKDKAIAEIGDALKAQLESI